MGGASSKQDAFVGSNSNGGDHQQSSLTASQAPCSCFNTFFCPPKNPNNKSSSKNNNSSQQHHHKTKSFGTPLPDTPENVRRIRAGENNNNNNGYYYENDDNNDHEEKKIGGSGGGGSFGRTSKLIAEVRSSRYVGLENEESGMFSYENKGGGRGGSGGAMIGGKIVEEEKSADIHDGKVSC